MSGLAIIDFTDAVVSYMQEEWRACQAQEPHDILPVGWTVDMVNECKHAVAIIAKARQNPCESVIFCHRSLTNKMVSGNHLGYQPVLCDSEAGPVGTGLEPGGRARKTIPAPLHRTISRSLDTDRHY